MSRCWLLSARLFLTVHGAPELTYSPTQSARAPAVRLSGSSIWMMLRSPSTAEHTIAKIGLEMLSKIVLSVTFAADSDMFGCTNWPPASRNARSVCLTIHNIGSMTQVKGTGPPRTKKLTQRLIEGERARCQATQCISGR